MKNYIKKILFILTKKNRNKIYFISFLSIIKTFIEIIGIGLLIPLLTFLTNIEKKELIFKYLPILEKYEDNEILLVFIIIFISVYFVKTVFVIFFNWYNAKFVQNLFAETADKLLLGFLGNDYSYFIKNNSAKIVRDVAGECNGFAIGVIGGCIQIISNFLLLFGIISLLTIYNYYSIFVIFILSVICIIIYKISDKNFKKWGNIRHIESGKFIQKLNEVFGSVKEIILYDKKLFFSKHVYKHLKKFSDSAVYKDAFSSITSPIIEFVFISIFFLFLSYLVFFSNNEFNEVVVIFGIFAFAAIRMLPNLVQIIRSFQVLKFNYPAINTVYNGLRKNNKKNNKKSNFRNIDSISFNKVNFAYPEKSISTLDNVNFKLKAGDKVGIIGETGSGKTTLINLISGLLLPTKGKILINSKNYINSEENKMNIGYVSQFVYVVDDSILFNIALSEEVSNKSKNFIIKLLQILNLKKLSNKNLRSPLGERGSKLSGGQIQRIGIARALYREPSILILDEATNALDDKTENKVLDYLFDKFNDKIIIFCTHKKKLLKYCTKIIEVKNKKIKVSNK